LFSVIQTILRGRLAAQPAALFRSRQTALALATLTTLLLIAGCGGQPAPKPPSNLVLICIDTVGAPKFFSERIEDALSPRLVSAQQYRNASSVAPWTIPAVASVLTGLYPIQHQAGQFEKQPANLTVDLPSALGDHAQTLPEILGENGFRSAAFSAHPWFSAKFGLEQGFDKIHYRQGWQKVTDVFTEWLDKKQLLQEERFFAYLYFMEAHDWHLADPKKLNARLAEISPELRGELLQDASTAACEDPDSLICRRNLVYNLAVRELRLAIAEVLQQLEDRGQLQDTLVMVYSDHGEEFWEHKAEHEQRGDPRGIYGFGHGQSLYQELLHVPLVAWHPQIEGAVRQDLVSLLDVLPTALAWLGVDQPGEPLPGLVLPAGTEPAPRTAEPRIVYASGISYGTEAIAAREGELKSILYYPDEDFEYFDLASDPAEKRPQRSDALAMRFDVLTGDYIDLKRDSLLASPEFDPETLEHLKSIGYLQGVEEDAAPKTDSAPTPEATDGSEETPAERTPDP